MQYYRNGEKVLLVKPQTFMNVSGESVGPLMRYYKIDPSDVYCIYDDMDLPEANCEFDQMVALAATMVLSL